MGMIFQYDWDMCNAVCKFLEFFYIATADCSGVYYLTTQLVITHIHHIANNFKKYKKNSILKDACGLIEIKFLKYWTNLVYLFALLAVMDPRIKLWDLNILSPLLINY